MPSRLIPTNPTFQERDRMRAVETSSLTTISAHGPWMGYTPDLPPVGLDLNYARSISGLSARSLTSGGSQGEVLMPLEGWQRVSKADPATDMPIGTTETEVIMLAEFPRTTSAGAHTGEETHTLLAWVAGDGTKQTAGTENTAELWRVLPSTQVWGRVSHSNHTSAASDRPGGGRDAIPDFATFAAGASARGSFTGAIADPVFIITNNVDPVYVFPSGTGLHTFEDLISNAVDSSLSGGAGSGFLAKSCEVFNNRVYFLNTSEAGTRRRQRLRRTPPFTCDPNTAQVGAGASDLKDFSGDGLRLERLGTVLAAYFEDGVAFIRATGNYTAPDAIQTISTSRGLISTHSLVNVGNDLHFGIFTDGWFYLDPSGRFQEVGLTDIGGTIQGKWKETFYSYLAKDPDKRGRLYCQYDQAANRVLISVPTDSASENEQVWVYDLQSDRVWLDNYEALCFGAYNRQLVGSPTYATTTDTYASIGGTTYASLEAQFGLKAIAHGTSKGYVFQHEVELVNRDKEAATGSVEPKWSYTSHRHHAESARHLLTLDRLLLEHVGLGNTSSVVVLVNSERLSPPLIIAGVPLSTGTDGNTIGGGVIGISGVHFATGDGFRPNGRILSLVLTGSGPFMAKAFEIDIFSEQVEVFQ